MYFITMGTVDVVSEDGEIVFDTLNEGNFFGEISCLCGAPSLTSFRYGLCKSYILNITDAESIVEITLMNDNWNRELYN